MNTIDIIVNFKFNSTCCASLVFLQSSYAKKTSSKLNIFSFSIKFGDRPAVVAIVLIVVVQVAVRAIVVPRIVGGVLGV